MNSTVKIPVRMQHLEVYNGYPVPYIVMRDRAGVPQFAVNNIERRNNCIVHLLCPICGKRLTPELWFAGGPRSAFSADGVFADSAMHYECAVYSLRVCPYLAFGKYRPTSGERIDALSKKLEAPLIDITQDPTRPKLFVLLMTRLQSVLIVKNRGIFLCPSRPYNRVEYWRSGERLSVTEALEILKQDPTIEAESLQDAGALV